MTIDQLSKRVTISGKYNQANKAARANAERLLETTGARTLAEALGQNCKHGMDMETAE
jgi:hypothetical protein